MAKKKFKHSELPVIHATTSIGKLLENKAKKGDVNAQKFLKMHDIKEVKNGGN